MFLHHNHNNIFIYFFKDFIYLFSRERRKKGEREGEKHWSVASCMPPTGDLAGNPGMFPDWELNWQPLGLQASAQSNEPHQAGHNNIFKV